MMAKIEEMVELIASLDDRRSIEKQISKIHSLLVHCLASPQDNEFINAVQLLIDSICKPYIVKHHLYNILPIILSLIEDHVIFHKVAGVKCVEYIIENVEYHQLKPQGTDKLILFTLKNLLYHEDEQLIEVLLICILKAMKAFKVNPRDDLYATSPSYSDEILILIMRNIQFCRSSIKPTLYLKYLPSFIEFVNVSSMKHYKSLIGIFSMILSEPTTESNFDIQTLALESWISYIKYIVPENSYSYKEQLIIIFKFYYTLKRDDLVGCDIKNSLKAQIETLLMKLKNLNEHLFRKFNRCSIDCCDDQDTKIFFEKFI